MNVVIQPPAALDWFLCEKKNTFMAYGVSTPTLRAEAARYWHLEARASGVIWGGISACAGADLPMDKYVPFETFVSEARAWGSVELCGLWVRREGKSRGLGPALMQAMMSVLCGEGFQRLYACGHSRLLGLYAEGGLQRDGRFAGFEYPPGYLTYCLRADLLLPRFATVNAGLQFEEAAQALARDGYWRFNSRALDDANPQPVERFEHNLPGLVG